MTTGITIAGNILVDYVKLIDAYPQKGMLTDIRRITRGIGGCVPNTAITLARLGGVAARAVGRVGDDEAGAYALTCLRENGVDVGAVITTADQPTSTTEVMTEIATGERTFFHTRGANAIFCPEDIPAAVSDSEIFHLGYALLLDKFDAPDAAYGTVLARFFADLQRRGIKTSLDAVSDASGRFPEIIRPALKYCDYCIFNEIEGGLVTGIKPRDPTNGGLLPANVRLILERLLTLGVKRAVVHCPEAGFALSGADYTMVPSLRLPKNYIQGTVGAGDAFCAGVLYAYYHHENDETALWLGACAAAANLSALDAVSGARSYAETLALGQQFSGRIL